MIGCFVAAVIIGYFGKFLPEGVKTGITEYVLLFLKDGFLNLLNTFIGLLIYLNAVTGICGIGSTAGLDGSEKDDLPIPVDNITDCRCQYGCSEFRISA